MRSVAASLARSSAARRAAVAGVLIVLAACSGDGGGGPAPAEAPDPAEVAVGERLFLETRFAEFFSSRMRDDVNEPLELGDPVMARTETLGQPLPGPFAGGAMNCRGCHLVDEQRETRGGGVRTYADFARRSPVPARADGRATTERNTPALVNATLSRSAPFLLHLDGEFASTEDLVRDTLTGRNLGWLADERAQAVAHVARVIREDDGNGELAGEFGGLPYRVVLRGDDPAIPGELVLPEGFRIDVATASDEEVLDAVARLIGAYVESLVFAQDAGGEFSGSPYDVFLAKNGLPRAPDPGESPLAYSRRLRELIRGNPELAFVGAADGRFVLHAQPFAFGERELAGLEIFFAEPAAAAAAGPDVRGSVPSTTGAVGNCIACHPAPTFTDFRFHDTGASQDEYDALHGAGAFVALAVPTLAERNADPQAYLPPSADFPAAPGRFRSALSAADPSRADLGLWNVYANTAIPRPQSAITALLCRTPDDAGGCDPAALLDAAVARFKTPGLRSLGQSAPYLHSGHADTLEDVLRLYATMSDLARAGRARNGDPELARIVLTPDAIDALAAFLRGLNEDYQ